MTGPDRPTVPELVDDGLRRTNAAMDAARRAHVHGRLDRPAFAARMAELNYRRARWWGVLERASVRDLMLPLVYVNAVVLARGEAEESARWWTEEVARSAPVRPRVAR